MHRQLTQRLEAVAEYQKKYYNEKHQPQTYKPGDMVLLSTKNIKLSRPNKKLDYCFIGPFQIVRAVGKQAYELDLPERYSRLHPVFHVSLLEPWRERDGGPTAEPPPALLLGGEEEWEVSRILDHRQDKEGRTEYLVRWEGYPTWEDSYEPMENLANAQEAIREYHRRRPAATPTSPRRGKRRRRA